MIANNLQLSNLSVLDNQHIQVDIAWENSWNLVDVAPPNNYDAIWLFIKYQPKHENWQHVSISQVVDNHQISDITLLGIETVVDEKGVFIKRKAQGTGDIFPTTLTLQLTKPLPSTLFNIKVFGIEMVHIPTASFYVGDGKSLSTFRVKNKNIPFQITSEKELPFNTVDSLSLTTNTEDTISFTIPSTYPKGYQGFYCMKYEITQEQYVDFLNTLSYEQQINRTAVSPLAKSNTLVMGNHINKRNGIVIQNPATSTKPATYACNASKNADFNAIDDGQTRACNFLNWGDVGAYLDWAALRPMTELEFEKVCRGGNFPVEGEYAWGIPNIINANALLDNGMVTEQVLDTIPIDYGIANHGPAGFGFDGITGSLRSGFAAKETTNRLTSGASYYGVLEMSGNVWELCVNIDPEEGLLFTRLLGDGELSNDGKANVLNWPSEMAKAIGHRGGAWNSDVNWIPFNDLAVSDRYFIFLPANNRRDTSGGRGVR